ncbi:hypothetical protein D3C85_1453250 [compost metagenome]
MTTIIELKDKAKENSISSGWPFGESYYKEVVCKYNPDADRYTFTIDYKRASLSKVEKYLNNM